VKAGKLEDAVPHYRDVLRRTLASAGPDHVYTATAHFNLGDTLRKLGRTDEARVELEAARAIDARIGIDNENSLKTLGALAKLEKDPKQRAVLLEDLRARQVKVFGETNRMVSDTINDLGNAARDAGDLDAASAYFERALAGFEKSLGPTHPRVAIPLSNLGEIAIAKKRFAAADTWCRRALAIDEAALGAEHPDLAYDLTCVGEAELGRGKKARARELLERALALRTQAGITGTDLARTKAALARAKR
jgi:tetratricopeptide (TPR) repeat protein